MAGKVAYPGAVLRGEVKTPGDKSISHRSLMLASQAIGRTTIHDLLESEDVIATANALKGMGVKIEQSAGRWVVDGVGVGGLNAPDDVLDMGNSGTSTRLLMGLMASYPFTSFFTGDASLRSRPMQRVMTPLEQIGARFVSREGGRLPLAMIGARQALPIRYVLPVASAQVKSAVLLAGLNIPGETTVVEPVATRDHTERMLRDYGVEVRESELEEGKAICITGCPTIVANDKQLIVPGDPSSAAFLAVAALICPGSEVTLRNVCLNPSRAGLFTTLEEMGANITYENHREVGGEPVADLIVRASKLKGIRVPAERAPSMIDEYPVLGVAAAFANGDTEMLGLEELRVKESDRLAAMEAGLNANGVETRSAGDSLTVYGKGNVKGGGLVTTHHDHRIAMSFLVMGMAAKEAVSVDSVKAIATSFPAFLPTMQQLGARFTDRTETTATPKRTAPLVIAIDGPAASGKGTLARRLASYYGLGYLDTGRLYRAVGLRVLNDGGDPADDAAAIAAAKALQPGDLLNPRLRQEAVGSAASVVSANAEVRAVLLDYQRNYAKKGSGAVLDGRDIGTVVCPDADVKFFITASIETRARRRYNELQGYGSEVGLEAVKDDLAARDARDSQRDAAPLKAAEDAIHIDTSEMDANAVFEAVVSHIRAYLEADAKQAA